MKKSKVLKDILKILKKWEDCKMDMSAAEAIFNKLDKIGVICPPVRMKKVHGFYIMDSDNAMVPVTEVEVMEWEDEASS